MSAHIEPLKSAPMNDNHEQRNTVPTERLLLPEAAAARVVALLCLIAFIWVAWESRSFPPPFNQSDVGAGQVPMLAAIGGIFASLLLLVQTMPNGTANGEVEVRRPVSVSAGVLIIVAYVLAMPHTGFYISSLIAIPLIMVAGGERKPLRLVLASVCFALFIYLGFEQLLGIEFP